MSKFELETDSVTEDELDDYESAAGSCNAFSFWYAENVNENAVVKDLVSIWGKEHCVVYDPDLDVTIDATLNQFDTESGAVAGAWDGEEYPYAGPEEVREWHDSEAFEAEYDRSNSPYVV